MAEFFVGLYFLTIFGVGGIYIVFDIFFSHPNYGPFAKTSRRRDQASIETWKAGEDY